MQLPVVVLFFVKMADALKPCKSIRESPYMEDAGRFNTLEVQGVCHMCNVTYGRNQRNNFGAGKLINQYA